jgi:hypothetical protein
MYRYITTIIVSLIPFQLTAAVTAKVARAETTINRTDRPSAQEVLARYERATAVMRKKVRFTAEIEQTLNGAFTFKAKKYKHLKVVHRDRTRFSVSRETKRFDDQNNMIGHSCLTSIHEIEKVMSTQNPYGQPPEHLCIDFRPESYMDRFLANLLMGDKLIDGITTGAHHKTFFEVMSEARSLQLRDEMEIVDGHETYVLEAETKYGKHILWIDPEYGFHPRRMAIHKVTGDYDFDTKLGDPPRPLPPNVSPAVPWCATVKNDLIVDNIKIEKIDGRYVPISAEIRDYEKFEDGQFTEVISMYKRRDVHFNPDFDAMVRNFLEGVLDETTVYVYHEQNPRGAEYKWYKGEVVDFQGRKVDYKPKKYQSLLGKPLPSLDDLGVKSSEIKDNNIIICFFDMSQRPSRHYMGKLAERAHEFRQQGIMTFGFQASKVDKDTLVDWTKERNIDFPIGMIEGEEEETRLSWGVRSLPWLILTDKQHIIIAEGFDLNELDALIKVANTK